jgi:cysteine desulfurase
VGFSTAIQLALAEQAQEAQRLGTLRDHLWRSLQILPGVHLNGHPQQRLPGNLNISIEGVQGNALLLALQPDLALSSGSACTTAKVEPSHVLQALGRSAALSLASLRFGLGRFTTLADIEFAAQVTIAAIQNLRG